MKISERRQNLRLFVPLAASFATSEVLLIKEAFCAYHSVQSRHIQIPSVKSDLAARIGYENLSCLAW